MLARDKDCPIDMIQWASGYANIENEELMRYAVSKKIMMQFMLSAQVKSEKKAKLTQDGQKKH